MDIYHYINDIKNCTLKEEVYAIMKGRIYNGSKNSKFEDNYILLPDSANFFKVHNIRLSGEIGLVFRLLLFMRFDGILENESLNSGKSSYFNELQALFTLILNADNNIKYVKDINHRVLEKIINDENNNSNNSITLNRKINKIKEWINFANENLPYFLQLENTLLNRVSNYIELKEKVVEEKLKSKKIGSSKEPYSLTDLKFIMSKSIKYIEEYSDEILYMARTLADCNDYLINKKYSMLFDALIEADFDFQQPLLSEYKEKSNLVDTKFEKSKGKTLPKLLETCINLSIDLEASCIIVILLLTGMRKSELLRLNRFPEITEDEFYNLSKFIYKTSENEDGEELNIPIPYIAKKAIEVLSELSSIKDKKNTGKILTISFFSQKEETYTDRPNVLIKYFCRKIGIINEPRPHQLRHAIAFLIAYDNEKDGLELARLFLGHKSITMTLQYLGHFNPLIRNSIKELNIDKSNELINLIGEEIKLNHKFYGAESNLLMNTNQFMGSYAEGYNDLITKSLKQLLKKGKIMIIQSATNLCIHDLTKKELMACQRGLSISNNLGDLQPMPSRCEGANCINSIFLEKHIEKLKDEPSIDENLRKRLIKNSYFVDFDNVIIEPKEKLIRQYNADKGIV